MGDGVHRVAVVQQAGLSSEPGANLDALIASVDAAGAAGARLVVPTELCLTPYFAARPARVPEWAVARDGAEMAALRAAAIRNELTLVAPVYLQTGTQGENVQGENAAVVVGPDGLDIAGVTADGVVAPHYAKVHLPQAQPPGSWIDEPRHFSAGRHLPVFDTPVGRIGVLLCYDRRFPEAWRSLALAGAEIVVVPSCIPLWNPAAGASTREMFVAELRVRATENPLYVIAACRAGDETLDGVTTTFIGQSCVVEPGGSVLALAAAEGDELLDAEVDLGNVAKLRRRLTVIEDRRPDVYALEASP